MIKKLGLTPTSCTPLKFSFTISADDHDGDGDGGGAEAQGCEACDYDITLEADDLPPGWPGVEP
jgi:hypothetical protein